MVNKDRLRLVVKEIRTGKYTQHFDGLGKVVDGRECYCILGIFCEVAIKNGLELSKEIRDGKIYYGSHRNNEILTKSVIRWYGFDDVDASIKLPDKPEYHVDWPSKACLACLNDTLGYTLEAIADVIEKEFLDD